MYLDVDDSSDICEFEVDLCANIITKIYNNYIKFSIINAQTCSFKIKKRYIY